MRLLGPQVAQLFADLHREHGVDLRCEVKVAELTGVRLADGSVLRADMVIVGIGITPNSDLAAHAGLDVGNGIHPRLARHIRVEHWANAQRQGATAARSMLGQDAVYDRLPYFFSDQYDLGLEYTGHIGPAGYDHVVLRGEPGRREFVAFWLADGRVLAGMNVNSWDAAGPIEELIESGRSVDDDSLADPDIPLEQL